MAVDRGCWRTADCSGRCGDGGLRRGRRYRDDAARYLAQAPAISRGVGDDPASGGDEPGLGPRPRLRQLGVHDGSRCLYCRQVLDSAATGLLAKYREYLEDRIASDISSAEQQLGSLTTEVLAAPLGEVELYISEQGASDTSSELMALRTVQQLRQDLLPKFRSRETVEPSSLGTNRDALTTLRTTREAVVAHLQELREQAANSAEALTNKEAELREFEARVGSYSA